MQKKRLVSFPMFCKGHQGRPPEQEPSASFSFPASIPISFTFMGGTDARQALTLFQRVSSGTG